VLVQREMEIGRPLLASIAISRAQFGRHRQCSRGASLAAEGATGFSKKSGWLVSSDSCPIEAAKRDWLGINHHSIPQAAATAADSALVNAGWAGKSDLVGSHVWPV